MAPKELPEELVPEEVTKIKLSKSQGEANRSERGTAVLAAKAAGIKLDPKSNRGREKKIADMLKAENAKITKDEIEKKIKEMVAKAGGGKLKKKGLLRRGTNSTIRASQIALALNAVPVTENV